MDSYKKVIVSKSQRCAFKRNSVMNRSKQQSHFNNKRLDARHGYTLVQLLSFIKRGLVVQWCLRPTFRRCYKQSRWASYVGILAQLVRMYGVRVDLSHHWWHG